MSRLALLLAFALGACAAFEPVEAPMVEGGPRVLGVDWAAPLYPLEELAFRPSEEGEPLHVAGEPGAPGVVVVPSRDRRVRGLDDRTGRVLWEVETRGPNRARPVPHGRDVLVGSLDGRLYRLHARSGRPIWQSEPVGRGGIASSPAIGGGLAFVTSSDNRITALSLDDGHRVWDRSRPHRGKFTVTGQAGATVAGDRVVTGFSDGYVAAWALSDGATFWSVDTARGETEFVDADATPLAADGLVVVSGYRSGLFALDLQSGETRWELRGEGYGSAAEMEGVLYVPRAAGTLTAIAAKTGEVLWTARATEGLARTPAASRKYLLLPLDTTLLVLDRGTGRTLLRYDDAYGFTATPEVSWGTVYAQANSGTLYALGLF